MKTARKFLFTAMLFGINHVRTAQSQVPAPGPLMLSIVRTANAAQFRIELRNNGAEALNLIVGMAVANNRRQYVDAVTYTLTFSNGKVLPLEQIGPAGIGGRVDPLIVPLPPGASFAYPLNLADCIAPKANVWKLHLDPGRYTLNAEYTGKPVSAWFANLDMPAVKFIPFWTGTVESSPLAFTIPDR